MSCDLASYPQGPAAWMIPSPADYPSTLTITTFYHSLPSVPPPHLNLLQKRKKKHRAGRKKEEKGKREREKKGKKRMPSTGPQISYGPFFYLVAAGGCFEALLAIATH